ncbi:NAD(P)-dependent oxidoreductase [Furfurilactobacillus milii]|uniref:NAD(P)H-binding protein n=1 Tax=Furfurilactobacillus rossiae TaxID=231049 RepID=A0A7C9IUS8_9LACO|nr:NAD(P)H-binding protein [Furfurilactobacillus milii]MYV06100.1 NAD(P)H-binding protein [Furfurilactobacillus milii]
MKLAIIGATGKSGNMILNEALLRHLDVTAIVRSPEKLSANVPIIQRDAFSITAEDLAPFDVIISAFGNVAGETREAHVDIVKHYLEILKNSHKRILLVGAASYLYTDEKRTKKLYDTLWMRTAGLRSGSLVLERAYLTMKENSVGFDWTFIAPAVNYEASGPRTGHYQIGSDVVLNNVAGKSVISYADLAVALMDEVERPKHLNMLAAVAN